MHEHGFTGSSVFRLVFFAYSWDDPTSLWHFHKGFPNGFTPVAETGTRRKARKPELSSDAIFVCMADLFWNHLLSLAVWRRCWCLGIAMGWLWRSKRRAVWTRAAGAVVDVCHAQFLFFTVLSLCPSPPSSCLHLLSCHLFRHLTSSLAHGKEAGFEVGEEGFSLSGPNYFKRFTGTMRWSSGRAAAVHAHHSQFTFPCQRSLWKWSSGTA